MPDDLIPLYKQMAETGVHFPGTAILTHAKEIGKLVKQYDARRLLDYGSGRGDAYRSPHRIHKDWGLHWFDIKLYDPAFERLAEEPYGKFDGVLCSDVLEHIPEDDLVDFIGRLFEHARKFVWASVCCRPAKKNFPNSEINLHVTLHPIDWWQAKFAEVAKLMDAEVPFHLTETP